MPKRALACFHDVIVQLLLPPPYQTSQDFCHSAMQTSPLFNDDTNAPPVTLYEFIIFLLLASF